MRIAALAIVLAACSGGSGAPTDGGVDASPGLDAPVADVAMEAGDAGPSCTANVSVAGLSAHNTSAFPQYDQAHFAANFGTTSWVSQAGQTIPIDPSKEDMSLNPVTPGHVSNVNVHTLIPSRPELRWFAHITPWFSHPSSNHIDIGLEYDSAAYVQSMVDDMRRRGFDGVIVDWYGQGSYEDKVTLLMQQYIDSLGPHAFTFIIMMDKGIPNLSESVLEQQIKYVQGQYFGDTSYELEGGEPILMFFAVDTALGSSAMSTAKTNTGGKMVWVVEGTGSLSLAWVDQVFDWTHDYHDGPSTTDPYNLAGVKGFYSAVSGNAKKVFGSMNAGFNGTLTKTVSLVGGQVHAARQRRVRRPVGERHRRRHPSERDPHPVGHVERLGRRHRDRGRGRERRGRDSLGGGLRRELDDHDGHRRREHPRPLRGVRLDGRNERRRHGRRPRGNPQARSLERRVPARPRQLPGLRGRSRQTHDPRPPLLTHHLRPLTPVSWRVGRASIHPARLHGSTPQWRTIRNGLPSEGAVTFTDGFAGLGLARRSRRRHRHGVVDRSVRHR
jgi:hypothetical protein